MDSNQRRTLVRLVNGTHRLARVAAVASGNTTPASAWRTLDVLESEGPQRIDSLAREVRVSPQGATQLAQALEDQLLVERTNDPEDADAAILSLTDQGAQALDDWRLDFGSSLGPMFDGLAADQWATLTAAVEILDVVDLESTSDRARKAAHARAAGDAAIAAADATPVV
ncbi:MarR family winged helix-turn-helix transcriptional regulator [Demequina aurantiaca]|uniref:MarR family winged helix-turn-helix transcriptional regulator n=1 Tax=Demequina aurantiaca TaxID=676200 RepID=UPI003D3486FB